MAQYNLIDIGTIISNTASGTGNVSLSTTELRSLYNSNTTTSGISLGTSNILYLDVDVGYRIKMDDVKLFIDVPGDRAVALTSVDFYYKNDASDSFILCSKAQDTYTFYPTSLPDIFAPRMLRVVIDSIQATIYELQVFNDDTQVSFGTTGNKTLVIVDSIEGSSTSLAIFNNSTIGTVPVTAYVIVNYQGLLSDYYVQLSDAQEGTYFGLEDGVHLEDNADSSSIIWNKGSFIDTEIRAVDECLINSGVEVGYYTTPVFRMQDSFESTFIMTDTTTFSGTSVSGTSVTHDPTAITNTVKIKSSNTAPIPVRQLLWSYAAVDNNLYLAEGNMRTGELSDDKSLIALSNIRPKRVIFDRYNHQFIALSSVTFYTLSRHDYTTGTSVFSITDIKYNMTDNIDVDSLGNTWGYSKSDGFRLFIFNVNLDTPLTAYSDEMLDFLTDLSADKQFPSCWYTDKEQNTVTHLRSDGTNIVSFTVTTPTYICSTLEGGCIVISNDSDILRYSYAGTLLSSFTFNQSLIVTDISYGFYTDKTIYNYMVFWILIGTSDVVQLNFDGTVISEISLASISAIEAFPGGCIAYSSVTYIAYQLDTDGNVERTWDFSSYTYKGATPIPVVIEYEEFLTMTGPVQFFPVTGDSIWTGTDDWMEVAHSGYKLPFKKYHQFNYKLTPFVNSLALINGDAETGDTTGWTIHGTVDDFSATNTTSWQGTYSFTLVLDATDHYIYQRIDLSTVDTPLTPLDNGSLYCRVKFTIKVGQTANTYVKVAFAALNEDLIEIDEVASSTYSHLDWISYELVGAIKTGARYIEIRVYGDKAYSTDKIYIDAISAYVYAPAQLSKVLIPKPVKVVDIHPQEYKYMYLKTEFPETAPYQEYETTLRCWWGNEED